MDSMILEYVLLHQLERERDDPINKILSKFCVRVENVIADLKNWSALRLQLRNLPEKHESLLSIHNKLWTIAAVFVNEGRENFCSFLQLFNKSTKEMY